MNTDTTRLIKGMLFAVIFIASFLSAMNPSSNSVVRTIWAIVAIANLLMLALLL